MDADRIAQLEKLGMIWSHYDIAWEEGLAAARGWAAEDGHLLAPLDATHQGYRVGTWLKNARAAARRAQDLEQRQAEGLPVESWAGALSLERREQLEEIDPSWSPGWPVEWQRAFHLTRLHLQETGGELPTQPGIVVHRGEDLGRWVRAQRLGRDKLAAVQQWMCEHVLGIEPASEDRSRSRGPARRRSGRCTSLPPGSTTNARDTFKSRGSTSSGSSAAETTTAARTKRRESSGLVPGLGNQRSRAATLTPERIEQLSRIRMRWT
ncbi:helicase associated domain-containing protein [Streptomyces chryseus]